MAGRGDYLLVLAGADGEGALAAVLTRMADEPGWTLAARTARLAIWTRGRPVSALPADAGFVVGRLATPVRSDPIARGSPEDVARRFLRATWGGFVAVLTRPDGIVLLRDPSGAVDCLTWAAGRGLTVAAADIASAPAGLRPWRQAIHWERLAGFLASPGDATAESLFDGVRVLAPGAAAILGSDRLPWLAWSPADHLTEVRDDPRDLQAEWVRRADAAVAANVAGHDRVLMELSGGLDSAIVAGSLAATGEVGRVAQWLNLRSARADADESRFARAVTDRLGVALTCIDKDPTPLTPGDFRAVADSAWPAVGAVDAARDRDAAERLAALDAGAILSGQGGDAVFYQMPTAAVAAVAVRRDGLAAAWSPPLLALARRLRRPVWSVWREARAAARGRLPLPWYPSVLLTTGAREAARGVRHPWSAAVAEAPIEKQIQVLAIANAQLVRGDCRRRRGGDILFPLIAQPVVEHGLAIPALTLAAGDHDRPFARAAFAARLPDLVRHRRAKGSLTAFFAQLVANSADSLRPFLIDGCLAEAGVIDRAAVDHHLHRETLITAPQPLAVLHAAAAEAWVRHWQGQVPDSEAAPRGSPGR